MQCDEKKEICLNYAAGVPEWQLDMTLNALAALGKVAMACGKVIKAVAGDLAWTKRHPYASYTGTIPIDRTQACEDAAEAIGAAVFALEIVLSQSNQFGFARKLSKAVEAGYTTEHAALEDRCREHGCPEVAYIHG